MDLNHENGSPLWYWSEYYLVVGGFTVSAMAAALVAVRSGWGLGGLLVKSVTAMAVLATLPLTLLRLGVDISVPDEISITVAQSTVALSGQEALGYLSWAGAGWSIAVGLAYLAVFKGIKDEEWVHRVAAHYRRTAMSAAYVLEKMGQNTTAGDQQTALALVLEEFPRVLDVVRNSPMPRSAKARRAKKNFEKALGTYISSAKWGNRLFEQSRVGAADHMVWERSSRAARATIVAQVSASLWEAREDMAKAGAYLDRPTGR